MMQLTEFIFWLDS